MKNRIITIAMALVALFGVSLTVTVAQSSIVKLLGGEVTEFNCDGKRLVLNRISKTQTKATCRPSNNAPTPEPTADTPTDLAVVGFVLVNADTNEDIGLLTDGATINLGSLPIQNLNVRAETQPATVGSVTFGLNDDPDYSTENTAPYALAGDNSGDYNAWTLGVGQHTVTAIPYEDNNGSGVQGVALTVTFTVIDDDSDPEPSATLTPTPSPTPTETETPAPIAKDLGDVGSFPGWSKVEIGLTGPDSVGMSDSSNPFQIAVNVTFIGPGGETFVVPAFYDGDGTGGLDGNVWKVRFSPNTVGTWSFTSTSANPILNEYTGTFDITDPTGCQPYIPGGLPDFSCAGRLQYTGEHYLKFADGSYWLKGGADEPEDFLAPGNTVGFSSKVEAIDYLASKGVNSLYMMLHNISGDGRNVWPWVGNTQAEAQANHEHFDVAKLAQWEDLFSYLQEKGVVLHLVFEDDSAWTGFNRSLYYREMIARFGHHNGLYWNISEEYNENYSANEVKSFAQMVRDLDPYDHPITVHHAGSLSNWNTFIGDNHFDLTSFQTAAAPQNAAAVSWFQTVETSGRTIPISFDETGQLNAGDRDLTRHIVWSVYLGGGNFEMFTRSLSDYQDFDDHFEDMSRARAFVEDLPFWQMRPRNDLLVSGQAYIFAEPGEIYSVYLPSGGLVTLNLSATTNTFDGLWFNPRDSSTQMIGAVQGGEDRSFTAPDNNDWVLLLNND